MGLKSYLTDTAKKFVSDTYEMAVNRLSHGASELAHGLFTQGSAYVPYGQNTAPMNQPNPAAGTTPAAEPSAPEPATPGPDAPGLAAPGPDAPGPGPAPDEGYQAQVALNAMRGQSSPDLSPGL